MSKPPETMRTVMPMATMDSMETPRSMARMLPGVRKKSEAKLMAMEARMMIRRIMNSRKPVRRRRRARRVGLV
jgi:hypothetical protein